MVAKVKLVQGDEYPQITVSLKNAKGVGAEPGDPDSWPAASLSGATGLLVKWRKQGTTTVIASLTGTIIGGGTSGQFMFQPTAPCVEDAGMYEAEIELQYPGGVTHTVRETLKFDVRAQF